MKKYRIKLSSSERAELEVIVRQKNVAARKKLRAQVLLACDEGESGPAEIDTVIASRLPITVRSIESLRAWACEAGPLGALLPRKAQRTYERKLDGRAEARLIAIMKEDPPGGTARWTLQLLSERLVSLRLVDHIAPVTLWRTLKKMNLSLT